MSRRKVIILAAVLSMSGTIAGPSPASAQSFQSYRCADGTRFILGFYRYDPRAYLQIDGRAVTLGKRPALSGDRYAGGGITLQIGKRGTTVKHMRRPSPPANSTEEGQTKQGQTKKAETMFVSTLVQSSAKRRSQRGGGETRPDISALDSDRLPRSPPRGTSSGCQRSAPGRHRWQAGSRLCGERRGQHDRQEEIGRPLQTHGLRSCLSLLSPSAEALALRAFPWCAPTRVRSGVAGPIFVRASQDAMCRKQNHARPNL